YAFALDPARAGNDMGIAGQPLQTEMGWVLVGEHDDLDIETHGRQPELWLVGINHDGGLPPPQPHGVQAEVGDFHRALVYIRSGALTPITPSAFAIVIRAARDKSSRPAVSGASSVTTRQFSEKRWMGAASSSVKNASRCGSSASADSRTTSGQRSMMRMRASSHSELSRSSVGSPAAWAPKFSTLARRAWAYCA